MRLSEPLNVGWGHQQSVSVIYPLPPSGFVLHSVLAPLRFVFEPFSVSFIFLQTLSFGQGPSAHGVQFTLEGAAMHEEGNTILGAMFFRDADTTDRLRRPLEHRRPVPTRTATTIATHVPLLMVSQAN